MPATNLSSITNSDNLVTDNVFLTALVKRLVQIKNEVFLPEFFTHGRNIQNMDVVNSNIDVVEFMDEKLSYQSRHSPLLAITFLYQSNDFFFILRFVPLPISS